jgi:hypothetical protein
MVAAEKLRKGANEKDPYLGDGTEGLHNCCIQQWGVHYHETML